VKQLEKMNREMASNLGIAATDLESADSKIAMARLAAQVRSATAAM
jgi:hypothetical protein